MPVPTVGAAVQGAKAAIPKVGKFLAGAGKGAMSLSGWGGVIGVALTLGTVGLPLIRRYLLGELSEDELAREVQLLQQQETGAARATVRSTQNIQAEGDRGVAKAMSKPVSQLESIDPSVMWAKLYNTPLRGEPMASGLRLVN